MNYQESADKYSEYLTSHIENVNKAYKWFIDNNILDDVFDNETIDKAKVKCTSHDQSKYQEPEFESYRQWFDPTNEEVEENNQGNREKFLIGWNHHLHNNPHHWEYWTLLDETDQTNILTLDIPDEYIIEMLCDWFSFSISKNDPKEIISWYKDKKDGIIMHQNSQEKIQKVLDKIANYEEENLEEQLVDEKIEKHETLNPKLWTKDNQLLPEIEEKIYDIVDTFKDKLEEDDIKLEIDDIYLVGSNVNYNYNDTSDLDIHIIADESNDCADKHLDKIYNAYKQLFNSKYDITLNGINVELYVETFEHTKNNRSNGVYSMNLGWIKNPSIEAIPDINEAKLEQLVADWEERYLKIEQKPNLKAIEKFIDDIYELRKESIVKEGDFGLGNLTFKEIRSLGYLDNLKELKIKQESKELSV